MTQPLSAEDASILRLVNLVLKLGPEQDATAERSEGRSFARTQVLLHAMSVFNQRGLEDTAVQDILDAAQISRRTFYKYFSGKLDVLESIYMLSTRVLLARIEAEFALAGDREQLIRTLVTICFDYQFSLGHIIAMMMEEAMRSASPLAPHRQRLHDRMRELLEAHLRRFGQTVPDKYLLISLLLALEGVSLQVLTQTPEPERAEVIRQCRQQMLLLWEGALR
jgi:AcrR family transcriptional regulator